MPASRLSQITGFLLLSWLSAIPLSGWTQEAVELWRVEEVLSLPTEFAVEGNTMVRLRGVITDVSTKGDELSLHDGTAGISVTLLSDTAAPVHGTEVEIEGKVYSETFNERPRTRIEASKITVHGRQNLPKPAESTITDVAGFKHLDQWTTVEGVVLQVRLSPPLLTIQLSTVDGWCNALVRNWPRDNVPKEWVGGTVRVTGSNKPYNRSTLYAVMVPSPEQVTVVKTGFANPFDAPAITATALKQAGRPKANRYKLTGTVIDATTGGVTYVRDADGSAFSIYQLFPLDEDTSGRLSTPVEMPRVNKPGDVVEVVGTPCYTDPGVHLNYSQVRLLRTAPVPVPIPTDIASVVNGKAVNNLVELHGRLVTLDDVMVTPTRFRTTIKIVDSGNSILAFVDSPRRGALADLRPDHLLKLRAVVTGHPHFSEIRLWLPTPRDVQSLGVASDVIARRVWSWIGITAACTIPLMVYVFMLLRSRKAIRELNSSLEKRVEERTAELASAKDDLSKALSQERDLNELKTRFISLVSHEFRTPLGITMSAVELLRHYGPRLAAEKQTELLDDIHSSTLRMSSLMEQVLILGRVEAGKTAFKPTPLNLEELCGKLTDEGLSATHHRCPVLFQSEGDFDDAHADESLVRHIFSNLISNAVKYSPEGSPVEFTLHRENGHALFTVRDRGIGIPKADQNRIFEAFHRAANVGEVAGTGLGLLLVKRCVDLHHGDIQVESIEGNGTTIKVKLPIHDEDEAALND